MLTCLLAEKETAFSSGVYPTVAALQRRGATAQVADPMCTADELDAIGLPGHRDEPVTAAVIQADHAEYRTLTEADLPGVRVLVDGRRVTDPKAFTTIRRALMCEEGCAGVARPVVRQDIGAVGVCCRDRGCGQECAKAFPSKWSQFA